MTRRQRDKATGYLVLLGLALAAAAFLGPFAVAGLLILNEFKARRLASGGYDDAVSRGELATLQRRTDEVFASGVQAGLVQRADGLFDGRKFDARRVNAELESLLGRLAQLQASRASWVTVRSNQLAARAALLAFVGVFVWLTVDRLSAAAPGATMGSIMFGTGSDGADRATASCIATICAALIYGLGRTVARPIVSS